MVSHLSECVEKGLMVGYGGLLTSIFKKFGIPLEGLHFPMSANNQIGAKCLKNLHLHLNEKGILEDLIDVEEENSDVEEIEKETKEEEKERKTEKEKGKVKEEKEDQGAVPSASTEKAEVNKGQKEACSKGEGSKEELEQVDSSDSSGDEEVAKPVKEDPQITPRKSTRLASKRLVGKDEGTSTHPTKQTTNAPSSTKPVSPIPSPPSSPIASIQTPFTSTGFDDSTIPPPPTTPAHVLSKILDLQSQLCAFQSETRVSLAHLAEQLTMMESRLGAKLDTVEVQTEYVDEETAA